MNTKIDTLLVRYEAALSHQWLLEGELQWCEDYNRSVKIEKEADSLRTKVWQLRQELTAAIEELSETVAIMHTAFAGYADSPAKKDAIALASLFELESK